MPIVCEECIPGLPLMERLADDKRKFTYYWYGCAVVKFETALPRPNGFYMFVTKIASNNDIRGELLNCIKADDLNLYAYNNDKINGSFYIDGFVACVPNAYLVAGWANLCPHFSAYKTPFDEP